MIKYFSKGWSQLLEFLGEFRSNWISEVLVFGEGAKSDNPEKNPQSKARINNKLKPHETTRTGFDLDKQTLIHCPNHAPLNPSVIDKVCSFKMACLRHKHTIFSHLDRITRTAMATSLVSRSVPIWRRDLRR